MVKIDLTVVLNLKATPLRICCIDLLIPSIQGIAHGNMTLKEGMQHGLDGVHLSKVPVDLP